MTKQETADCVAYLLAAYPNAYRRFSDSDIKNTVLVWGDIFLDMPAADGMTGIRRYIASDISGFPPAPGQVMKIIRDSENLHEMSAMEAWNMVKKAVDSPRDGYKETFNALPELIRKTIGSHDQLMTWGNVDTKQFETVIQSNFMRSYEAEKKRAQELRRIPDRLKRIEERNVYAGITADGKGI